MSQKDPTKLGCINVEFLEDLYSAFRADPQSVPEEWHELFKSFSQEAQPGHASSHSPTFVPRGLFHPVRSRSLKAPSGQDHEKSPWTLQDRVDQLVLAFRSHGHLAARLDPLELSSRPFPPELDPAFYEITEQDLERQVGYEYSQNQITIRLRELIARLQQVYCSTMAVQYMHIDELQVRQWVQDRLESEAFKEALTADEKLMIFRQLASASLFEEFIRKKFVGAKTFSLEGCESLLPLLELAIDHAAGKGVEKMVIGMAHRGRLNVLANVLRKPLGKIFQEFRDEDPHLFLGSGDVKYHLGYSNHHTTISGRKIHLALCDNPSHLEFVNPVAMGQMRAWQDFNQDVECSRGMVALIHGDAAFAGEGVVQESLNLSRLEGFKVGGTLHIVLNNQIGFTTTPAESYSGYYATDAALMLHVPIFHVNGEDPETIWRVVKVAMEFQSLFKRDVVIDLYGYRRFGHNEADDPSFTQPLMYALIQKRKSIAEEYRARLEREGILARDESNRVLEEKRADFEKELNNPESSKIIPFQVPVAEHEEKFPGGLEEGVPEVRTELPKDHLQVLLRKLCQVPPDFQVHPKIKRGFLMHREEMADGKRPLDWSAAEALALASLAEQRHRIRLTGQDSERGTFSQRHAVLHDVRDGRTFCPFHQLSNSQAPVSIYNSPLSEAGVLGFEYGYSLENPDALVLWEAQFGDFANAAQVIIDQFISSGEDKWRKLSGLVLLLPHGFEGTGPEHSSARLERFLELCAEDNMQVVYPTTPAQYFHVLRRQVLRSWRKPLVVMTPKSLLRHPKATSPLEEFSSDAFHRVLRDKLTRSAAEVRRVLLCSGKIYYELEEQRAKLRHWEVAIIRLEQLHPFSLKELDDVLSQYSHGTHVYWVQEEPENMGAWPFLRLKLGDLLFMRFPFHGICRPASASPATGSSSSHRHEQEELLARAFGDNEESGKVHLKTTEKRDKTYVS